MIDSDTILPLLGLGFGAGASLVVSIVGYFHQRRQARREKRAENASIPTTNVAIQVAAPAMYLDKLMHQNSLPN